MKKFFYIAVSLLFIAAIKKGGGNFASAQTPADSLNPFSAQSAAISSGSEESADPTEPSAAADVLIINEIMQSNIDILYVDHDFPDSWVELYNPTDHTINLAGWALCDVNDFSAADKFTSLEIAASGYALIYCDKEETLPFHTSFRVDSGKNSTVFLFNPDGEVVDNVKIEKKMFAPNVAYGRIGDGAEKWGYLLTPTPGEANGTANTKSLLPLPLFSREGGLCTEPFDLEITIPEGTNYKNLLLCVTTDGREPTRSDAVDDNVYTTHVSTSVSVRAKIFADNAHSPLSLTQSYIFHPRETELTVVALTIDKDYLLDENEGILVEGPDPTNPNYWQKHRKPLNVEVYLNGKTQINQVGEIRVSGRYSATLYQKPLIIYANKRFVSDNAGMKNFNTKNLWDDKPDMKSAKSFILRTGGGKPACFYEPMLHLLLYRSGLLNNYVQAYRPSITYINGELAGLYNIRERSNEDWVEANFPDVENFDMAENWYEVKEGDISNLLEALYLFQEPANCTFENFEKYFETDNFANSLAYQFIIGNTDYFYNNVVLWRIGSDKWKFLQKDLDFGVGASADIDFFDRIAELYDQLSENSSLYKAVKFFDNVYQIPEINELLKRKIAFMLGDFMHPDNFFSLSDNLMAEIIDEAPDHMRINHPWGQTTFEAFNNHVKAVGDNYTARHEALWNQLPKHFNVAGTYDLTVDAEDNMPITFNGDRMSMPAFKGRWFTGSPLSLAAVPADADKVIHAEVTETDADDNIKTYTLDKINNHTFDNAKSVKISFKENKTDGIENVTITDTNAGKTEYYDLTGRRVSSSATGILIRRQGNTVTKVIK